VTFNRQQDPMLVVTDYIATTAAASSDIGVKTFDEIDASYAAILEVDRVSYQDGNGNFVVDETYQELRQSLPAVEDIEAFLSSSRPTRSGRASASAPHRTQRLPSGHAMRLSSRWFCARSATRRRALNSTHSQATRWCTRRWRHSAGAAIVRRT
jgi:hypothetical protein